MSWSITMNDIGDLTEIPPDILAENEREHPMYPDDMMAAMYLAKRVGLKSATLAGGRTPNPYNQTEVTVISVTGIDRPNFGEAMTESVTASRPEEWDEQRREHSPES